ncbi:MAG: helix-turn-helix domain-containing protein [Erythrobacter sp.]|nr:helix-turn-helix domain-containing protein [Erythrobacter sp.]
MTANAANAITIRFALPCEALRPYVTTYYLTQAQTSKSDPLIEDYLHPEWANLRSISEGWASAAIGGGPLEPSPAFAVTGPTSQATRFRIGDRQTQVAGGSWGIGLLPLGWAKLTGASAHAYADRVADGNADPAFDQLRALGPELAKRFNGEPRDFAQDIALIDEHLTRLLDRPISGAEAIAAVNAALVDPDVASAAQLADAVGMTLRSLERLSRRAFGFPPKLLLRRQRFLRCLSQFMLDPSLKWLNTLDTQYHDQAHFVRDFKRFMGMTPRQYAKLDKPLLIAAAQARMAIAGEAVQGLHDPQG